ncbi:unnamed protein product [Amoebophrya sp. A120]|nr:unnamed protein product [Amoebophrya sp. A120]|eukprot:GSA120T00007938001.1
MLTSNWQTASSQGPSPLYRPQLKPVLQIPTLGVQANTRGVVVGGGANQGLKPGAGPAGHPHPSTSSSSSHLPHASNGAILVQQKAGTRIQPVQNHGLVVQQNGASSTGSSSNGIYRYSPNPSAATLVPQLETGTSSSSSSSSSMPGYKQIYSAGANANGTASATSTRPIVGGGTSQGHHGHHHAYGNNSKAGINKINQFSAPPKAGTANQAINAEQGSSSSTKFQHQQQGRTKLTIPSSQSGNNISDSLAEGNVIEILGRGGRSETYRVLRPLGKGSFGCVWQIKRALDTGPSGRDFALKEIRCIGEKAYRQAQFEVELMRQLGKKSVRAPLCEEYEVRQVKRDEWRIRVVMSRLPGEPLDSWIERARGSERLSPRRGRFWRDFAESSRLAYRLLAQLAPTFEQVEQKALHRDVNSHNILISSCTAATTSMSSSNSRGDSSQHQDGAENSSSARTTGQQEMDSTTAEEGEQQEHQNGGSSSSSSGSSSAGAVGPVLPAGSSADLIMEDTLGAAACMDFWLIDFGLAVNAKEWRGRDYGRCGRGGLYFGAGDQFAPNRSMFPTHHDEGADGMWKVFDIGGDCKYWPPSSWKQFLYGWKYLQNSKDDCRQYRTRLDHFAMGITCMELLFHLCDRVEEQESSRTGLNSASRTSSKTSSSHSLNPESEDCPSSVLAQAILDVYDAWKQYWRDATRIWQQLFATFKGTSGKDWQQLKQQFCKENVSQVSASNVTRLKAQLQKCSQRCAADPDWCYLSVLMSVLHDLISECGSLTWRDVSGNLRNALANASGNEPGDGSATVDPSGANGASTSKQRAGAAPTATTPRRPSQRGHHHTESSQQPLVQHNSRPNSAHSSDSSTQQQKNNQREPQHLRTTSAIDQPQHVRAASSSLHRGSSVHLDHYYDISPQKARRNNSNVTSGDNGAGGGVGGFYR